MRNILLKIAYRGTNYGGYQVQPNKITIAEVLQDAIEKVFGTRYDIKGASRTDAGVHANNFAVTFKTEKNIPTQNIIRALNVHLPDDVAVKSAQEVDIDFHPRYDALKKRYIYKIWNSVEKNPFFTDMALHIPQKLNVELMQEASKNFIGTYDFTAFCNTGCSVEDKVRTINNCTVTKENNFIHVSIEGDGFLYNMVRIIVGTLLSVSMGKILPCEIIDIIESKDRKRAGITVPAHGLYLDEVFYNNME